VSGSQAAVWVEVPGGSRIQGKYDGEQDIHFVFGEAGRGQNVTFEREALKWFVNVAVELLAMGCRGVR
jgi:hypothetical protein